VQKNLSRPSARSRATSLLPYNPTLAAAPTPAERNSAKRERSDQLFAELSAARLNDDFRTIRRLRALIVDEHEDLVQAAFKALCAKQNTRFNPDDAADLLQCARTGLTNAADRFQPERGFTYATYAYNAATGAMLHWIRDRFNLIREPAKDYYARGQHLRDYESGARLQPPPDAIRANPRGLMNDDGGDQDRELFSDLIADDFAPLQTEIIATREVLDDMKASAGEVENAARAVELVIGEQFTPGEAAAALQLTTEAVEKLVEAGLRYLRAQLGAED